MTAEHGGFGQDLRWRVGALVFGMLLLVGAACAAWTLHQLRASSAQTASQDGRAIAQSVAQTLAQQLGRAARLGIPLAELPGVPAYLEATLRRQPLLDSIAVLQPDGSTLHAVGQAPARDDGGVRVEIASSSGAPVGFVRVGAEVATSLRDGLGRALPLAALAVFGLALVAALAAALGPGARLEAQRRLALARLHRPHAAELPSPEGAGAEGPQAVLEALARGDEQLRDARATLNAYGRELLAMDFDGQLRAPIERILRQAASPPEGG